MDEADRTAFTVDVDGGRFLWSFPMQGLSVGYVFDTPIESFQALFWITFRLLVHATNLISRFVLARF